MMRVPMVAAADVRESSPFFRRLAEVDLERLAAIAVARGYEKGDVVFSEGDAPAYLHTIVSGRVKMVKRMPSGKEVILEIMGPGDPLGAVVAYEDRPYPATAVALEPVQALLLPRSELFAMLEQHPSVVRGFLSGMARRIVELTQRIPEVAGGRVETRFALLFLKLSDNLGRSEGGDTFIPLSLSRQDLADLTGTTLETSIRVMSRWGKEGIVHTAPDGFRIADRDFLDRLANA
jgi:CRP/FNR family transcriptional regulator